MKSSHKENIWVLVYTKAKQEVRANQNLSKQGFKTFLPLISETNKNNNTKSLVPIFPRYIFVEINLKTSNWSTIRSSYGVSKIVMFGDGFTIVPEKIINLIKSKLNKKGISKENISQVDYKSGDSLTIKEGWFAGIEAIFLAKKSNDRVRLLLNLLNTKVISEVSKTDIGQKEVIKNFKF